jgi:hypothetical protein
MTSRNPRNVHTVDTGGNHLPVFPVPAASVRVFVNESNAALFLWVRNDAASFCIHPQLGGRRARLSIAGVVGGSNMTAVSAEDARADMPIERNNAMRREAVRRALALVGPSEAGSLTRSPTITAAEPRERDPLLAQSGLSEP